jgi:hypothetical protein
MLAPAEVESIPATKNEFVLLRRTIRKMVAFGTAVGATMATVLVVASPPAADATDGEKVRPVAVMATAAMMDERRRTQNSWGWSDMDNPSKTGLQYCKRKVQHQSAKSYFH